MKTKRIKAVHGFAHTTHLKHPALVLVSAKKRYETQIPVVVIPNDAASYERMVEQMANRAMLVIGIHMRKAS